MQYSNAHSNIHQQTDSNRYRHRLKLFQKRNIRLSKLVEKVNELQALAIRQATRCKATYNSESLNKIIDDAIRYMKETKYTCVGNLNSGVAATAGITGFGKKKTKQVRIADIYQLGSVIGSSPIAPNYTKGYNDSNHEGAAILFHESLHFTESDNTQWHHHPRERNIYGCSDSLFEDRVYFIEAACFPLTPRGRELFIQKKGAAKDPTTLYSAADCSNICKSAFQNVDTSKMKSLMAALGRTSESAKPFTPGEVQNICQGVSEVRDFYRKFQRPIDIQVSLSKNNEIPRQMANTTDNAKSVKDIESKVQEVAKLTTLLRDAREKSDDLKSSSDIRQNLVQLKGKIDGFCNQNREQLNSFCKQTLENITEAEIAIQNHIELITSSNGKTQKLVELLAD